MSEILILKACSHSGALRVSFLAERCKGLANNAPHPKHKLFRMVPDSFLPSTLKCEGVIY